MNERMTNWLVVGSSDGAEPFFDALIDRVDETITTNAGWQYFLTRLPEQVFPDHYWLSDHVACKLFRRPKRYFKAHGTEMITAQRDELDAIYDRDMQDADRIIELPTRGDAPGSFTPGSYVHPRLSGLVCLQIAVNSLFASGGRGRVFCIGMEGYRSKPTRIVRDTFDGRMGKPAGRDQTFKWIKPFTQSVVDALPGVEFVLCGKLTYRVSGPNVKHFQHADELTSSALYGDLQMQQRNQAKQLPKPTPPKTQHTRGDFKPTHDREVKPSQVKHR